MTPCGYIFIFPYKQYTKTKASELKLVGWCRNTHKGTVAGIAQGPPDRLDIL